MEQNRVQSFRLSVVDPTRRMLLRANGSSAVKRRTIIPPSRRREASTGIGFLTTEQITPAELLRILLIRAGIETNPGPRWNCCICRKPLNKQGSVRCSKCGKYAHYKCTPFSNASHYLITGPAHNVRTFHRHHLLHIQPNNRPAYDSCSSIAMASVERRKKLQLTFKSTRYRSPPSKKRNWPAKARRMTLRLATTSSAKIAPTTSLVEVWLSSSMKASNLE